MLLQVKLRQLHEHVKSPGDWIVIADSDELYDYTPIAPSVQVGDQRSFSAAPCRQFSRHQVSCP